MTLGELIRLAMDARLAQVRVAIPARVESYDVAAQTVDVKPLIKDKLALEDGDELVESIPVIPAVPVAFMRGGGFFVSFPIAKGDTGRVVVCDRSLDQWRKKGGEVDPIDVRMHSWAGAVFEPDLADSQHALGDAHGANLVIGMDGGVAIHLTPGGEVHLGEENPTEAVALAQKTLTELQKLATDLTTLKAAFAEWVVSPADGGSALKTATAVWVATPVSVVAPAASKTKAL